MDDLPSTRPPRSISTYVEDGARIAAILLVWGIVAAFFTYGVGNVGPQGRSVIGSIGRYLGILFGTVGIFNAVLYVIYRAIDYWDASR